MSAGTVDYEIFDFKAEENPLDLDEAVKKAQEMRRGDNLHFYRVRAIDPEMTKFTVKKVNVAEVYTDFVSRVARLFSRRLRRA